MNSELEKLAEGRTIILDANSSFRVTESNPSRRKFLRDGVSALGTLGIASFLSGCRAETDTRTKRKPKYLSPKASFEELVKYVKNYREEVDYKELWPKGARVLFLGEHHGTITDEKELTTNMKTFADMGVRYLGLEEYRDSQPMIDRYMEKGDNREELLTKVFSRSVWNDKNPEAYLAVVDAAKEYGIKVLCLDESKEFIQNNDLYKITGLRNARWAEVMHNALKADKPSAKGIVYGGALHSRYPAPHETLVPVNIHLNNRGQKCFVIEYGGGIIRDPEPSKWLRDVAILVSSAAQKIGIADQRFGIRLNSEIPRNADYVIHLPQREIEFGKRP